MPLKKIEEDTNREKGLKKSKMLVGGQAKLDKNKNNKIDAEDFKILKAEKKGKPMKAALGAIALGIGGKKMMDKNKMSMPAGMGAAALLAKKKKEILGKRMGGVMKARKGKLVPLKSDPTKAISSVKPSAGGKGGPPGKTPKEAISAVKDFMARRKKLAGIGKAGRIGAAAALLGLAGAGAASLGQKIGKKLDEVKKKNKKMGGGMIGGSQMPGYKTGTSVKARGCKLGRNKPTKMY